MNGQSDIKVLPFAGLGHEGGLPWAMPAAHIDYEWLSLVKRCFAQLDESHRRMLTLRVDMNLSYAEIAAELHTHVDAVRAGVRQAREALRALLARHGTASSGAGSPAAE